MSSYILALDQGTSSSRAIVLAHDGAQVAIAQQEFPQLYPHPGEVEHDPEAIWSSQIAVGREALRKAGISARQVAAIGISNQRETTVLWERDTGQPVANAVVWQSRVSAGICGRMKAEGLENAVREKTGLMLDAYFSASKIKYLLDSRAGLRARAGKGEILFGTVETFLIWRMTGGKRHVTDLSNASRTLLLNIHSLQWDPELLAMFEVPSAMLPEVVANTRIDAVTDSSIFGAPIAIGAAAGDQQAAMFGQGCLTAGMVKNTYGTGCFAMLNTGPVPVRSEKGLLTTIAWQHQGEVTYGLEGAVFIAGAVVRWLRDGLRAIGSSSEIEQLAGSVPDNGGVYFVPAFVGLGAPYWDPYARGMMIGLTRDSQLEHIARAALESIAFQSRDVLDLMQRESNIPITELRVDGGAAANDQLLQFQADLLRVPIRRPRMLEVSALGAAAMAGVAVNFWKSREDLDGSWSLDRKFTPQACLEDMESIYALWRKAAGRARDWVDH